MADYNNNVGNDSVNGAGWSGMGGNCTWLWFILILFFLFKDGFGRHGERGEHYGNGCNPCETGVKNVCRDQSNYEQDLFLDSKFDKIIAGQAKAEEKANERYIQDLRDRNHEKDLVIAKQQNEMFTGGLIGGVMREIADIKCQMPERRPQWASTVVPCAGGLPGCGGEPRRSECDCFG
jgi:hypothetical protein